MGITDNQAKTLPELPRTTTYENGDQIWMHRTANLTDYRMDFNTLFSNVENVLPRSDNAYSLGTDGAFFANVSTVMITVGEAGVIQDAGGTLQFSTATVNGDLTVGGNLTVVGSQTEINVESVTIEDNLIQINSGQIGVPASSLVSGVEVQRGTENNYVFIFVEETDTFRIGEEGQTQAVATREDTPTNGYVAVWNSSETRFVTVNDIGANAATASKWQTPRTITLGGDTVGNVTFDGSEDVTLSISINNDSHTHDTQYYPRADADTRFLFADESDTLNGQLNVTGKIVAPTFEGELDGNAGSASRLKDTFQIQLTGGATGISGSISGADSVVSIPVVVTDDDHNHDTQYYPKADADTRFVNVDGDAIVGNLNISDDGSTTKGKVTAVEFIGDLTGNADSATIWATPRKITLNGDLTGDVTLNGNADVILNATVVDSSHEHNQYYTKEDADARFLNVSATAQDAVTGNLNIDGTITSNEFIGPVTGNADTATALQSAMTFSVSGDVTTAVPVSFTGIDNVDVSVTVNDNSHDHISANISDATNLNNANMIVKRDANGDFAANNITANLTGNVTGNVTGDLTGNADTATALETSRSISLSGDASGSVNFDGAADADIIVTVDPDQHTHSDIWYKSESLSKDHIESNYYNTANSYNRTEVDGFIASRVPTTGAKVIAGATEFSSQVNVNSNIVIGGGSYKLYGTATAAEKFSSDKTINFTGDAAGTFTGDFNSAENVTITVEEVTGKDGTANISADANVTGSLTVGGDLVVNGTTTTVNSTELEVQDNIIRLNKGIDPGVSPVAGLTGIEFWRGAKNPFYVVFDESDDKLKAGVQSGGSLKNVALIDDDSSLVDGAPVVWNNTFQELRTDTDLRNIRVQYSDQADEAIALKYPETINLTGMASGSAIIGDNAGTTKNLNVTIPKTGLVAESADKLSHANAGVSLTGVVNADNVVFDGSGQITLSTTFATPMATSADLSSGLAGKSSTDHNHNGVYQPADANIVSDANYVATEENFTTVEKTKLSNIAENANNYVHPGSHPATMITEDIDHKFVTDSQIAGWDAKVTQSEFTVGLAAKSNTDHNHPISDVAELQTELDGKANSSHAHSQGDISGLSGDLDDIRGLSNSTLKAAVLNLMMPEGYCYWEFVHDSNSGDPQQMGWGNNSDHWTPRPSKYILNIAGPGNVSSVDSEEVRIWIKNDTKF